MEGILYLRSSPRIYYIRKESWQDFGYQEFLSLARFMAGILVRFMGTTIKCNKNSDKLIKSNADVPILIILMKAACKNIKM